MYIIDGAIAVFVGILTILLLPNFPDQYSTRRRHWLFTTEELNLACERAACKLITPDLICGSPG